MPIIVRDYAWRQTENTLTIHVPLHGAPKSSVDLFIGDDYFKASFEQFFYECYPYGVINSDTSKAIIQSTEIVFELRKQSASIWPELQRKLTKPEQKEVKLNALRVSQEKLTKEVDAKRNKKYELKREAVSMAVALDTKQRNTIAAIKEEEKTNALGDVAEWTCDYQPATKNHKPKAIQSHCKKVYHEKEIPAIPMPRNRNSNEGVLEVAFTARELPTPSRESQEMEETEWLAKQQEARRSAGFVSEDLRPEEKNPHYILAKGQGFLEHDNYLGAISAFSFGIQISPNLVDFYILRSQAQFGIGNHHKCVRDCSTALEMMKPEVYANLSQRVECIHRRGLALFKLGLKRQAADELKAAIKLQPSRELTRDLYEIVDSPEYVEKDHEKVALQEIDH